MGGPYAETGFGLDVDLTAYAAPLAALELLFSESHGRAVVTCAPERASAVAALARELGVAAARVGTVGEPGGALTLRLRDTGIEHPVDRLRQGYFTTIPPRMGDLRARIGGLIGVTRLPDPAPRAHPRPF